MKENNSVRKSNGNLETRSRKIRDFGRGFFDGLTDPIVTSVTFCHYNWCKATFLEKFPIETGNYKKGYFTGLLSSGQVFISVAIGAAHFADKYPIY